MEAEPCTIGPDRGGGPRPRDDPPLLLDRDRRPRARPRSARRGRPTTRRPAGSSRSQTLLPGGARLRTHRCRPAEPTCQHRRCPVTPARHPASAAVRLPRAPTPPPPDHRAVRPPTSGRPSVRTTWRTGTSRRAAEDSRCVQSPRTGVRGWLGRNIQQSAYSPRVFLVYRVCRAPRTVLCHHGASPIPSPTGLPGTATPRSLRGRSWSRLRGATLDHTAVSALLLNPY